MILTAGEYFVSYSSALQPASSKYLWLVGTNLSGLLDTLQPTIGKVHAETPRDDGLRVYEICVQAHFARRRRHRE